MEIHREEHKENYTVISNNVLRDTRMSIKARGILTTILSLTDNWEFSVNGLMQIVKDGRESINNAIKELEDLGYLKRERITNEKGQFKGYNYSIFENPLTEKPFTEKPFTGKPFTGNSQQLNTDILSTDISNNDISNTENKIKKSKEKKEKQVCRGCEATSKKKKSTFHPLKIPSLENVIKYAKELNIENAEHYAELFILYNQTLGWEPYVQNPNRDWKKAFVGYYKKIKEDGDF